MTLLSVNEARERILSHLKPGSSEPVSLAKCLNRVPARDLAAATDLPLFDNSSMDGFAIRSADGADASPASPRSLRVIADIPAGTSPKVPIAKGEAARIMTGAQLPEGADAVIPVEDTDFENRDSGSPPPDLVKIFKPANPGDSIRYRGMDIRAGDVIFQKGQPLKSQDLGLLAMLGFGSVEVYRKPRVALFSSGDELLAVDAPLEPGKIRDSNSIMLAALIESTHVEVVRLGVARDNFDSVKSSLEKAVTNKVDLILTSAGVSVGAYDFVKDVIESNGSMDFWRVNMRPGKPLAFGEYKKIPFIGLPGNPVSAFVGFEVFVRVALERLSGSTNETRQAVRVRTAEEINSDGRESYLRARVYIENGVLTAKLTGHQGSGNLFSLVQGNALLIIPAGVKCVPAGQEVDAWYL